ncbi:MAG: prolyl oligopeptidase family serine peptidase [Pirellulaceae bacterium]|nr:prolyl oligopeptidase family serine peptidase [Pirellulaceae bacterium]
MKICLRRLLAISTCCLSLFIQLHTTGLHAAEPELAELRTRHAQMQPKLKALATNTLYSADKIADAAVFSKAAHWALTYELEPKPADLLLINDALDETSRRMSTLEANQLTPSQVTTTREPGQPALDRGKLVCGYISSVDDSVQPYGLIVPEGYDPKVPIRLDVVLHGSSKPVGMSELRFMRRFHEPADARSKAPQVNYIELHPLGRVENCYRWSGETDVFEAIEAVCRRYNIDRQRIVLRGMSMGASGTWHLGLKHPDRFVALGPYCGYVDTYQFSHTPVPDFIKVDPLPPVQHRALHMLDSIDYAANAGIVPVVACMGEKDIFFQAHVLMNSAMEREGLKLVNLISPGTGHVIDPVTHAEQMRQIASYTDKGLNRAPRQLRFVTWTLKYNHCHWLELLALDEHYARAEVAAQLQDDGSLDIHTSKNVRRFAIDAPLLQSALPSDQPSKSTANHLTLRIDGQTLLLPLGRESPKGNDSPKRKAVLVKESVEKAGKEADNQSHRWRYESELRAAHNQVGKRPGVQGPIDDAFTSKFLCVRGTGTAWNSQVHNWAEGRLQQFTADWHRYFRGDLPIKNDSEVTEADLRSCNLILFGDPGSNRWIKQALPNLPFTWEKEQLKWRDEQFDSAIFSPACIYPSPFSSNRTIVINSGHSFGARELAAFNYLLFPRHGDWALFDVNASEPTATGFFNEDWKFDIKR